MGIKKLLILKNTTYNSPENIDTLYKLNRIKYPILNEDLYITGKHALLVDTLTEKQRLDTIKTYGKIYITDDKYKLCACDEKTEKLNDREYFNIYHFCIRTF